MSGIAFLFPGQGTQRVGMGQALHARSPVARDVFARADAVLGLPLTSLCFSGPEAELRRTENAQPALFAVSAAAAALLRERGVLPDAVAGHSVGEYAALAAAGAMSFEDGLRTVRRRGELMADAAKHTPGTMAAIVGLPLDLVESLCAAASSVGCVEVASDNGPRQIVISGETAAVHRAMDLAEEHEGALAVPLDVAGAFHSRLMASVGAQMAPVLATLCLRHPVVPVVANATADYVRTPEAIRDALIRQIPGRVRWRESVRRLAASGVRTVIEAGSGRSLGRLVRDVVPDVESLDADEALRRER